MGVAALVSEPGEWNFLTVLELVPCCALAFTESQDELYLKEK